MGLIQGGQHQHIIALSLISLYLVGSFFIVKDYGLTWDEPHNFAIGHKYLDFYKTGHLDFQDELPFIEKHPDFYAEPISKGAPWMVCPLPTILSAGTCLVFYQKLHCLDVISAHHIIMPMLTAGFLYLLFLFVKRHWGGDAAIIAMLALLTYPRFFGHGFNNVKDMPAALLFAVTIFFFAEYFILKKLKYLYLGFIFWGLALASKITALLVLPVLFLWQLPLAFKVITGRCSIRPRILLHILMGGILTCIVLLVLYPPLLPWAYENKGEYLIGAKNFISNLSGFYLWRTTHNATGWSVAPLAQAFYVTPVAMIVLFIAGIIYMARKNRTDKLYSLLIIWVSFPVIVHCLSGTGWYDGIRLFVVFLVPLAIIVSIGVIHLSSACSKLTGIKKGFFTTTICALFLFPNIYSLISTHPYQTTYFNFVAGGLKGAQGKKVAFSSDYWLNSYREAGTWLDENAKPGSFYFSYPLSSPHSFLLQYSITRKDLKPVKELKDVVPGTYIVMVPRYWADFDKMISIVQKLNVVYRVERQGGEIVTIYYKPLNGNKRKGE